MEQWGTRETVKRCVQHVFKSIVDWRVLSAVDIHLAMVNAPITVTSKELGLWLTTALLLRRGSTVRFEALRQPAELFPFMIDIRYDEVSRSKDLLMVREGGVTSVGVVGFGA